VHALDYQITIHSSLTVDDTLFDAYVVSQLNSFTTVQGSPESKDKIQLHLIGCKNFNALLSLPNGIRGNGYIIYLWRKLSRGIWSTRIS
jgi:hypothetical protein